MRMVSCLCHTVSLPPGPQEGLYIPTDQYYMNGADPQCKLQLLLHRQKLTIPSNPNPTPPFQKFSSGQPGNLILSLLLTFCTALLAFF